MHPEAGPCSAHPTSNKTLKSSVASEWVSNHGSSAIPQPRQSAPAFRLRRYGAACACFGAGLSPVGVWLALCGCVDVCEFEKQKKAELIGEQTDAGGGHKRQI